MITSTTASTTLSSGCAFPYYQGDNYCDDENNNANCDYDGGDCCRNNVNTTFCTQCQCLDPAFSTTTLQSTQQTSNVQSASTTFSVYSTTTSESTMQSSNTQSTTSPSSGCHYPDYQGDNVCDDENNNANCQYDGDDCCGPNVDKTYCALCECLDPAYSGCFNHTYKGDDYCDDENNNESCDYDGGDCCGNNVDTSYCTQCRCLDPGYSTTTLQTTTFSRCGSPNWIGDNFCDDENNNANCNYDGGDCCMTNVNTTFCTQCKCLDPANGCTYPDYKNDDSCDDQNNIASCDYDGGDCCGENVGTLYCIQCECLDPAFTNTSISTSTALTSTTP